MSHMQWSSSDHRIYVGATKTQRHLKSLQRVSRGLIRIYRFNTLRPRQNGRRFTDDTFKRIFLNENVRISIEISLKFVPKGPINKIPALIQIMAWRRPGDKPLSQPMMVKLLTHVRITRPQWVKSMLINQWVRIWLLIGCSTAASQWEAILGNLYYLTCGLILSLHWNPSSR